MSLESIRVKTLPVHHRQRAIGLIGPLEDIEIDRCIDLASRGSSLRKAKTVMALAKTRASVDRPVAVKLRARKSKRG